MKESEKKEVRLSQQLEEKKSKIAELIEAIEVREKTLRSLEARYDWSPHRAIENLGGRM